VGHLSKSCGGFPGCDTILILDALDECEADGRTQLIRALSELYSRNARPGLRLKVLISSRPYPDIEWGLRPKESGGTYTVRISGDSEREADAVQREVDLFIDAKIHQLVIDCTSPMKLGFF
jgi:hypothetical protein